MKIKIIVIFFVFFQSTVHADTFSSMCVDPGSNTYLADRKINSFDANSISGDIFVSVSDEHGNKTRYIFSMTNNTARFTYSIVRLAFINDIPVELCVQKTVAGSPFLIGIRYL